MAFVQAVAEFALLLVSTCHAQPWLWPRQYQPPQTGFLPDQQSPQQSSGYRNRPVDTGSYGHQRQGGPFNGRSSGQPVGVGRQEGTSALPDSRTVVRVLVPGQSHDFTVRTRQGGNLNIVVFPCHGAITWNITDPQGRVVKEHHVPELVAGRSTGLQRQWQGQAPGGWGSFPAAHQQQASMAFPSANKAQRTFGQSLSNGVWPAAVGLGTSIGNAVASFVAQSVSEGEFTVRVHNPTSDDASFRIFSTAQQSPYPTLPVNSQLSVTGIRPTSVLLKWEGVSRKPLGTTVRYCVEYRPTREVLAGDVHTSPCAAHRANSQSRAPHCTSWPELILGNLNPSTEYVIDLTAIAQSSAFAIPQWTLESSKSLPYGSVRVRTAALGVQLPDHKEERFQSFPLSSQVSNDK